MTGQQPGRAGQQWTLLNEGAKKGRALSARESSKGLLKQQRGGSVQLEGKPASVKEEICSCLLRSIDIDFVQSVPLTSHR